MITCPNCAGFGMTPNGRTDVPRADQADTCPLCGGAGEIEPCEDCNGDGVVERNDRHGVTQQYGCDRCGGSGREPFEPFSLTGEQP